MTSTDHQVIFGRFEGGHMSAVAGRVVLTKDAKLPFKVILTHLDRPETERHFAQMRDAEAFIRRNTPIPAARSTLFDRSADEV